MFILTILDSIHLFKLLIHSTPTLLNNRTDMSSGGAAVDYFLYLSIYQLQCIHYLTLNTSINMNCYRAIINLVYLKMFYIENKLFIQTCQLEILRILLSESVVQTRSCWFVIIITMCRISLVIQIKIEYSSIIWLEIDQEEKCLRYW